MRLVNTIHQRSTAAPPSTAPARFGAAATTAREPLVDDQVRPAAIATWLALGALSWVPVAGVVWVVSNL